MMNTLAIKSMSATRTRNAHMISIGVAALVANLLRCNLANQMIGTDGA